MNAQIFELSARDYHADRVGANVPTLSASVAGTLVKKSPRHAWRQHPALGGAGRVRKSTDEQAQGTLIHALVLGKGLEQVEIIEAKDYRTKAAQEARDQAEAEGRTPILAHKFAPMERAAKEIVAAIEAEGLKLNGMSEAVMTWTEDTPAGPVACRGMTDHVILDTATIIDLKTCHNAHPKAVAASIFEHRYDLQRAAYVSAVEKLRPDLAGRVRFFWVFAEMDGGEVIDVSVGEAAGTFRETGETLWRKACETWAVCLRDNYWPGFGRQMYDAPPWALAELEGMR